MASTVRRSIFVPVLGLLLVHVVSGRAEAKLGIDTDCVLNAERGGVLNRVVPVVISDSPESVDHAAVFRSRRANALLTVVCSYRYSARGVRSQDFSGPITIGSSEVSCHGGIVSLQFFVSGYPFPVNSREVWNWAVNGSRPKAMLNNHIDGWGSTGINKCYRKVPDNEGSAIINHAVTAFEELHPNPRPPVQVRLLNQSMSLLDLFGHFAYLFRVEAYQLVRLFSGGSHLFPLATNGYPLENTNDANNNCKSCNYPISSIGRGEHSFKAESFFYVGLGVAILAVGFLCIQIVMPFFFRNEELPRGFMALVLGLTLIIGGIYLIAHLGREAITQSSIAQDKSKFQPTRHEPPETY